LCDRSLDGEEDAPNTDVYHQVQFFERDRIESVTADDPSVHGHGVKFAQFFYCIPHCRLDRLGTGDQRIAALSKSMTAADDMRRAHSSVAVMACREFNTPSSVSSGVTNETRM